MPPSTSQRPYSPGLFGEYAKDAVMRLAPGGIYACPVEPCDATWDVPEVTVTAALDASGQHTAVYTGVQNAEVEREVRAHLEGHDVEDWVFTIRHIRCDVTDLASQLDEAHERLRAHVFKAQRVTVPVWPVPEVGATSALIEWQTALLCEWGAKFIRARENILNDPAQFVTRMELIGELSGIRVALCLLHGLDPRHDSDKDGPADDMISAWIEQHPEVR